MERSERLTLLKKLATSLAAENATDLRLTLRQFELPNGDQFEWQSDYDYAVAQIEDGSDAQLLELQRYLLPDDPVAVAAVAERPVPWAAGMFRLFVSHTSAHRESAGRLRDRLGRWGVDAFVAHDAIEPTREWQDEILLGLSTCEAMCALVTSDFVESRWCDQEVGFAVARDILIVPVKAGVDPHGFIAKYQAITVHEMMPAFDVAHGVFDALARNRRTSTAMAPAIIRRYANSGSYDNTRAAFVLLETIPKDAWTAAMIEQVEQAADANSQVHDAVLPGGREVPKAAEELLDSIRGDTRPGGEPDDDLIMFEP